MITGATKANQSSEKLLAVLELLATQGSMRLKDIASELKIPPSTTLRFINSLVKLGYAQQDQYNLRYELTYKLISLSNMFVSNHSFHQSAHASLVRLSQICKESCSLGIEDQSQIVYIDVINTSEGILNTTQRIGKIAPLYCTGIGKILLQQYTPEDLDRYINKNGMPSLTVHTLTKKQQLLDELKEAADTGFAYDRGECEIGVHCIATGICDYAGKYIAGISVSLPVARMTDEHIRLIKQELRTTAKEISSLYGYLGP